MRRGVLYTHLRVDLRNFIQQIRKTSSSQFGFVYGFKPFGQVRRFARCQPSEVSYS